MTHQFLSRSIVALSVVLGFATPPPARAAVSSALANLAVPEAASASQSAQKGSPSAPGSLRQAQASLANVPLSFEINRGQTSGQVQWLSRGPDFTLFLAGHDAVLEMNTITPGKTLLDKTRITGAAVRMNLVGASATTQSEGLQPMAGRANYFHGNNPAQWQRDVPTFGKVKLPAVYPGVDLIYYGHNGHLEYDFVVAPGADPSAIRLGFEGAKPALTASGDLLLEVAGKKVTLDRPVVFQDFKGSRQPIDGSFAIAVNNEVTFHLGTYDHTRELTIDPVLLFDGTFGSGGRDTVANALTVDSAGEMIFTGATHDLTFPTTTGSIQTGCGASSIPNTLRCTDVTDAFVTKISADGKSLVFSTYLSGSQYDEVGNSIAVDAAGVIYVVGATNSSDFPITSDAFQKICSPIGINPVNHVLTGIGPNCGATIVNRSMFLLKINPAGNALLYGTFLGGSQNDVALGVALDPSGNIYISGASSSASISNFPNNDNSIKYPTTATAFQFSGNGGQFYTTLSKFSNDGHTLLYSTFLGAPIGNLTDHTYNSSLAVGANGVAFVGGTTFAITFPTTPGALKPTCAPVTIATRPQSCGQVTGFVAAIDTTKSGAASLVYSTFIGPPSSATGVADQYAYTYVSSLLADSSNDVYVTGSTQAVNFPTTTGAYQTTCPIDTRKPECNSAYLAKINPTGTAFLFSTYYAGPDQFHDDTAGYGLAADAKGRVYLYGLKDGSCDLPVLNPVQANCAGFPRVFVAAFSSNASQLLFGTDFGSAAGIEAPIVGSGMALDSAGNIYFGGLTTSVSFPTTTGTYASARTGASQRSFFGKISPVLAPSATGLTVAPATTVTGQTVTFTASVTGVSQSTPAPTGSVGLTNTNVSPATVIGTIQLGALGNGTFTTSSLAAGTYKVVASYSSDATYDLSSSAVQTLTINPPVAATATFTPSATSVKVGSPVTLNITVSGAQGSGTPTGTVFILDGASSFASVVLSNGIASYTTSALTVGVHPILLNYTGDNVFGSSFSTSQAITVSNYSANVALSASPTLAIPGANITLTSTIAPSSGTTAPTGKVTFLDGGTAIGSGNISNGTATLSTTTLGVGTHNLTASYGGDSLFGTAVSSAITVTIRAAAATTTVVTSSALAANPGAPVTFTATIASSATTGSPTGSVSFSDGVTLLGSGTVANGIATFTTSSLAVGSHQITGAYGGDSLFLSSTSTAITQTVATASYTAVFTPSTVTITRGQSASVSLTVTPVGGFNQTVTYACAGLPAHTTCTFSPASLTLNGVSPSTSTLTIATNVATATLSIPDRPGRQESGRQTTFAAGLLGLIGLLAASRRRKKLGLSWTRILGLLVLCIATLSVPLLVGCGSTSPANQNQTPVGTSNVTVTVTSGTNQQSAPLTVVIQ